MKKISYYFSQYFSLIGLLTTGFVAFKIFSYDKLFQLAIAVATSSAYVVWGIVHHGIRREVEISIVIEYIIVASLGLVLVLSLIFRA